MQVFFNCTLGCFSGDVDELSSNIGLSNIALTESWQCDNFHDIAKRLFKVQCTLQEVNSCIATPLNASSEAHLSMSDGTFVIIFGEIFPSTSY